MECFVKGVGADGIMVKDVMERADVGRLGEDIASKRLKKFGYKIVERNKREKWGELDIIVIAPDKTLVFVEVKTVTGPSPAITPEDQVTASKMKKFKRAAELYANGEGARLVGGQGWRTDLMAIIINGDSVDVTHYENV